MTPPDDTYSPILVRDPLTHTTTADPLWYKDAIIYQLHVKAFFDADDDGIGDFEGLRRKLDYLQDLGATALWLLPFYPSPLRDDGYDIADYKSIHPSFGRMADFKAFIREAHRRNLRVITELIINHTSDQHPWFQRARHARPRSSLRDFYVWSDTDQKFQDTRIIFVDAENSNWAWDPVAQAYFWHRFYSHQPDLNFDNPRVFRAVSDVMRFWLDLGVDGMRLDAVPYLIEREGTINENLPETHEVLRRLRKELDKHYADRMLLAEANQWPEDVLQYFGAGDECHMALHFPLMPRIYMAVSTEDRHPITDIMRQTPDIPETCQWAVFLRNHDELTLEMVTDRERDYLWSQYAADRQARLNLGIRRRLAPLMENDRRKIELLNALLISMPGTPIFYYGDEIGMGDNVFLRDRDGVRTPMQWSFDRNGGFSRADPARLYLPPIMDPVYGFTAVNVEAQSRSPSSLLNWVKRLIAARRSRRAFGRGTLHFLYPSNRKVIAYLRAFGDEVILCVANLSRSPQAVELDLAEFRGRQPVELLGRSVFPPMGEAPYLLTLQAYSFFWFDLLPTAQEGANLQSALPEFVTLVMPHGWSDLFRQHNLPQLEKELIPAFLLRQRWFDREDARVKATTVRAHGQIAQRGHDGAIEETFLVKVVDAHFAGGGRQRYFLPLAAIWSPAETELRQGLIPVTLAQLRQVRREGAVVDAVSQDSFALALADAISRGTAIPLEGGEIRCCKTASFEHLAPPERLVVRRNTMAESNSSVFFEDYGLLKIYRHLQAGPHPEIEMSRFLTECTGFANTPPLIGTMELALDSENGPETYPLGGLFGFVRNQGDGWSQALNHLTRYMDDALLSAGDRRPELADPDVFFLMLARQLGIRTAEMHRALGENAGQHPDFTPEAITPEDICEWRNELGGSGAEMLSQLERNLPTLPIPTRDLATRLLALREELFSQIFVLMPDEVRAHKTRYHGDFHLGHVIVVQNDFFIIDFQGETALPFAVRRRKSSPLRDVAGMIRSFDYAAAAAVRNLAEARPAAEPRMTQLAEAWRQRAVDGFRAAYRKTMRGCAGYPASKSQAREMLAFFTLERAVREASYELANRPDWVDVPLKGILDILTLTKGRQRAARD
jgi:maltose alpha-D-glucosyltransferase / alpha-amylase